MNSLIKGRHKHPKDQSRNIIYFGMNSKENYSIYMQFQRKLLFTSNGFVGKLYETIHCENWF